jgi:hypothetical protein
MLLTGGQIRAARAFLRWPVAELAKRANIGVMTVRRAEASDDAPSMLANNMDAIRRAFEAAGIEFLDGEAPGVRLLKGCTRVTMESQ